jgi:branched-chain amino acid transport system permease protein
MSVLPNIAQKKNLFRPGLWMLLLPLMALLLIIPQLSGLTTITMFSRIFILAIFGMSYDILRGYTGIINLGHALFFGGGTYIAGILFSRVGPTLDVLLLSFVVAFVFSAIIAYVMGQFAFRGSGFSGVIACAMITLAFGEIVRHTAETFRQYTQGADGLTFMVPPMFRDRMMMYYYALLFLIILTLVLRRFVNSPTGRVLQAIRDNEQRARFLGYDTKKYKLIALVVAGMASSSAGIMFALLTRFANTELLSVQNTLNALLYTIVGGTGTLYGAIVGTAFVQLAQNYLLELRGVHDIFSRWLIFFGAIYVLVVLYMPMGIVGTFLRLQERWQGRRKNA